MVDRAEFSYGKLLDESDRLEDIAHEFATSIRGPNSLHDRQISLSRLRICVADVEAAFTQYEAFAPEI